MSVGFALIVSDVVWQSAITNGFWLGLIILIAVLFRRELRSLLGSVASFKVAGASFELKDRKATIESWAVLTNILVEILSKPESADPLAPFISDASVRQLTKFAVKYAKEVRAEDKDVQLLNSVAYLVGRKGNTQEAISIYDTLLEQSPGDRDVLNLKGALLLNTANERHLPTAEQIFDDLVTRYPEISHHWFNLGLTKSRLGKFDESLQDFSEAKRRGWDPKQFDHQDFKSLREARPEEFAKLREIQT